MFDEPIPKGKVFDIPIQEIKDIKIKSGFIDFLVSGKTFEVITQSGFTTFRCVRNADELKAKTLGLKNKES